MKLKNGKTTKDPRLDRIPHFDRRSRKFPIRELIPEKKPRSYTWRCSTVLDQGNEGSCVGHGFAHELLARPAEASPKMVNHEYARMIYFGAQKRDPWPGGAYPGARPKYEGTDVLSGVQEVQALGWCESYRWGFSLDDLILGVGYNGPAVMGLNWLTGMMDTDSNGFIHATGGTEGGHCVTVMAVTVPKKRFTIINSWSRDWGMQGFCYVTYDDMEKLLAMQGEQVFLQGRKSKV